MKSLTSLLLVLAAAGFTKKIHADPAPPPLTHILTANVTAGTTIIIGAEAGGMRVALPIAGGTFTGARLNGTLLPVGIDTGLITADDKFYPDGTAILQTSDGANIIFRDQGYQTGAHIYGSVTFETGSEKYAWLNTVVGVSNAVLSADGSGSGIALDIFMVGDGSA